MTDSINSAVDQNFLNTAMASFIQGMAFSPSDTSGTRSKLKQGQPS